MKRRTLFERVDFDVQLTDSRDVRVMRVYSSIQVQKIFRSIDITTAIDGVSCQRCDRNELVRVWGSWDGEHSVNTIKVWRQVVRTRVMVPSGLHDELKLLAKCRYYR